MTNPKDSPLPASVWLPLEVAQTMEANVPADEGDIEYVPRARMVAAIAGLRTYVETFESQLAAKEADLAKLQEQLDTFHKKG